MKKDDILELEIIDIGSDGQGIGKADGFTLFVKDAIIGDIVKAKIIKMKKNYGYGRLMEIVSPSNLRTEPKCEFHRQCGGCQIQAMNYDAQLKFKQDKVRNNIVRIGGFDSDFVDNIMQPIIGMEEPFFYRNKAQFPFGTDKNGNIITGFYAGRTHSIIKNTNCCLGIEENELILKIMLKFMEENNIKAYDEVTHKGLVRHVLIRKGFKTGEIMVCVIINGDKLPHAEKLINELCKIDGMKSITLNVNKEKTNVIMGTEIIPVWGEKYITDYIGDVKFRISPLSFYQVNPIQTEKLYKKALEYAGLNGDETVWDLYCGIGTISLFLAQKVKKVYGVEIVPNAIMDARENAKLNNLSNVEFFVGKAEEVLPEQYEKNKVYADIIVVDPPRKGCDEKCLNTILKMQPKRVVYVSCDSATLARDLRILYDGGYKLEKIQAVDQFSQTVHVESVVLLSQQKADDYLEVEIDLDELDATSAETKATYEEIKKYVAEHNDGMKVSNLYIAQVKKKCGIELGQNFNLPKSENAKQPQCPKEKEDAIVEALKAFQMI